MKENQNNQKTKLGKKKIFKIAGAVVALAAITVAAVCLTGGQGAKKKQSFKIPTPYIDLLLPLELEDLIISEESTYGDVYTRAFYMSYGGQELPLWRVDFGDLNSSDWVGRIVTDTGDIPVAMTGFSVSNEEIRALGEEGSRLYGECMQGYSFMLDGLMEDSRFTTERSLVIGEDKEVKLTYWNVTLPDKMSVRESSNGGNYEAVFSGEVVGETVTLYRVCIGGEQVGSLLGYFEIDGVKKSVFIESYPLAERASWNDDDYATANHMMATVNDVIGQITSSKNYSEFTEE